MSALVARAPTRLDLGGGWTDVPPYPEEQGGTVCALAIARYATVHLSAAPTTRGPDGLLPAAALRVAGLGHLSADLRNDFPIGAGLGGSSAAGVALAAALRAWQEPSLRHLGGPTADRERHDLAESSRRLEVDELGIAGGRQDHYAAAFGGPCLLHFGEDTRVERLAVAPAILAAFVRRAVLVHSGESRLSGDTVSAVLGAYGRRERRVVDALATMKALATQMAAALCRGDLDALGGQLAAHWVAQRALHPGITTPRIDAILAAGRAAGALGGKALGASGGGCVLLLASADRADAVRAAVAPLGEVLPFALDGAGVTWRTAAPSEFPSAGSRP